MIWLRNEEFGFFEEFEEKWCCSWGTVAAPFLSILANLGSENNALFIESF
jgi:hypothetical protein